jgi:hypothetical protein
VTRLFGDQVQDQEAEVAVSEQPPDAPTPMALAVLATSMPSAEAPAHHELPPLMPRPPMAAASSFIMAPMHRSSPTSDISKY